MSTTAVLPVPLQQFMDNNGAGLSNGLLYSYEAGTAYAILQPLYQDASLSTEFSNPIMLTVYGRISGPCYALLSPAYDFILKDSAGVTVWTA